MGLEVTCATDDLAFIQHSAFLLQFTDKPNALNLFTNRECNQIEANAVAANIVLSFHDASFTVNPAGRFTISQNADESIALEIIRL